jgi:hypothetical protein
MKLVSLLDRVILIAIAVMVVALLLAVATLM